MVCSLHYVFLSRLKDECTIQNNECKWLLLLLRGLFGGIARLFGVTGDSFWLGCELDDAVNHECVIRDTNHFCRF